MNFIENWATPRWKRNLMLLPVDNIKYALLIKAKVKLDLNLKSRITMDGEIKLDKKLLKNILDLLKCKPQRSTP